jgi:hypothetical protein
MNFRLYQNKIKILDHILSLSLRLTGEPFEVNEEFAAKFIDVLFAVSELF